MKLRKKAKDGDAAAQQQLVAELKESLGQEVHRQLAENGEEGLTEALLRRWLVRVLCSGTGWCACSVEEMAGAFACTRGRGRAVLGSIAHGQQHRAGGQGGGGGGGGLGDDFLDALSFARHGSSSDPAAGASRSRPQGLVVRPRK